MLSAKAPTTPVPIQPGLRANWQQIVLLVAINAFVGGMVGIERTILPLLAEQDFGQVSRTAILSFLVSFGLVKAFANLLAGRPGDRSGRKRILVVGWLRGMPVLWLVIFAPTWGWVVFANALLGINQGLCWSTTLIIKVDLMGPRRRGLARGFNEAAGYLATAFALRPQPFPLREHARFVACSFRSFFVRESRAYAMLEAAQAHRDAPGGEAVGTPGIREVFMRTSWKDRTLFAVSQAGLVHNLNDGLSWGLFPLSFAATGLDTARIGWFVATYPAVWGVGQLATGALSDRWGRRPDCCWDVGASWRTLADAARAHVLVLACRCASAWSGHGSGVFHAAGCSQRCGPSNMARFGSGYDAAFRRSQSPRRL